ncbi:16S rRNA processing protein RimM [candidate division KSB1 bacterium]|nr:16S rRNA processing protein RimM [candidate division KSB1 bacterium]
MHQPHELICIGEVLNAHGIRGDIIIKPWTDDPDQFDELAEVYITNRDELKQFTIEKVRITQKKIIVKFRGIDNRNAAEQLRGALLQRQRSELRALAEDEYFIFDLIGLDVKSTSGETIGSITDVMEMPAHDVYVVQQGSREVLIPAVKSIVKSIDLDAGKIIIDPIDGLIE